MEEEDIIKAVFVQALWWDELMLSHYGKRCWCLTGDSIQVVFDLVTIKSDLWLPLHLFRQEPSLVSLKQPGTLPRWLPSGETLTIFLHFKALCIASKTKGHIPQPQSRLL